MADASLKVEENVAGKYYVDEECIACELCTTQAPDNFKMNDEGSTAFVYKQPEDGSEEEVCEDAMESCPVDAIGDDGK